jgi:hypothetical protein
LGIVLLNLDEFSALKIALPDMGESRIPPHMWGRDFDENRINRTSFPQSRWVIHKYPQVIHINWWDG